MYVTCNSSSEVVAFDLTKDSIIARIPIPYQPWGAAMRPNTNELWTATYGSNAVHIINTSLNQLTSEVDSVSQFPRAISFTPDGVYAYVACELAGASTHHHGGTGPASSYVVIDCNTRKVISIQELPALSVDIAVGYR
jgi:DNA-binding beta-propeller fold protein YncE